MHLHAENTVSTLLDMIYQAILEPEKITDVMQSVSSTIDAGHCGFQVEDCFTHSLSMAHLLNYDDAAIQTYADYYIQRDPWMQIALARGMLDRSFVASHKLMPDKQFRETEFYVDWGKSEGVRHAVGTAFNLDGAQMVKFSFQRGSDQPAFEPEVEQLLELLRPHLMQFVTLAPVFEEQKQFTHSWLHVFDHMNRPVWILDKGGRLLYMNALADQALSVSPLLYARHGYLMVRHHYQYRYLLQTIFAASQRLSSGVSWQKSLEQFEPVTLRAGAHEQAFWLLPLSAEQELGANRVMMIGAAQLPDASMLANAKGLTLRQAEVCLLLAEGYTFKQISQTLNIAVNTVRNLVYDCFRRLQVSNQAELLNCLFGGMHLR